MNAAFRHQIDEITHADSNNSTRARRQAYKPPNFPNTLWDKKTVTYFYDASIGECFHIPELTTK